MEDVGDMGENDNSSDEYFLQVIQVYPCLWNKQLKEYYGGPNKENAMIEISATLRKTGNRIPSIYIVNFLESICFY